MTALTGETGAGKTLLVEALGLLLGGRADPSVVRAGTEEAMVEGRFAARPGADEPTATTTPSRAGPIGGPRRPLEGVDRRAHGLDRRPVGSGRRPHRAARTTPAPVPGPHRCPTGGPRRLRPGGSPRPRVGPGRTAPAADESAALGRRCPGAGPGGRPAPATSWTRSTPRPSTDADEDGRLEAEEDRLAAASSYRSAAGRGPGLALRHGGRRAPSTGWPRPPGS